jgi:hypothetical protein
MKAPYRASNGVWYTKSLFLEQAYGDTRTDTVFSLYDDVPGLINCQRTFVELGDPTGYKWAMMYLRDWNHWQKLIDVPWFREAYETWVNELSMKQRSEAIARIQDIARSENDAQALPASKYIAERGWEKSLPSRGRPSKSEVAGELKRAIAAATVEDEDAARIGLTLIKGGKS